MTVLLAKLGKGDNKHSDVSLGLRRLHYNSCSINRSLFNVSYSMIFKEAFIAMVPVQSTSEWGFSSWSCINREPCVCHEISAIQFSWLYFWLTDPDDDKTRTKVFLWQHSCFMCFSYVIDEKLLAISKKEKVLHPLLHRVSSTY